MFKKGDIIQLNIFDNELFIIKHRFKNGNIRAESLDYNYIYQIEKSEMDYIVLITSIFRE